MSRRLALAAAALLLAAACSSGSQGPTGSAGATPDGSGRIEVSIRESLFRPGSFRVEPGSTVTFVITNHDPIDHEFIVGNEKVQNIHEEGTEAHHGDKPGEISIPAGTTRTTTYTFEDPGTLLVGCHLPGHYAFGMKGEITIAK